MVPFDQALERVIGIAKPMGTEIVPFNQAAGRVLAEDLVARSDAPAFDVSAMDGYGVRERDVADIPAALKIVGESFAGSPPDQTFPENGCIRIFTGAPVPPGIDRVIIQENVARVGDIAHFKQMWKTGLNIRQAGSDFKAGDCLLSKGRLLNWRAMTTAAAADQEKLALFVKPKVIILVTGDELASPGTAYRTPGLIAESVSYGVATFAEQCGAQILRSEYLADDPEALSASAQRALNEADVVIVTGGASVGEKDYARSMFGEGALEYIFRKVAMKPGKPVWMAKSAGKIILGLPGNPSSALVTTRLFLAPLLAGLTGRNASAACKFRPVTCHDPLPEIGGRETFSRAYLKDGQVVLFSSQDSSAQASLAQADILVRRPANSPSIAAGAMVSVLDF